MANQTQFYFAWSGPSETFGNGHQREDELIFGFELKHEEGQFAELELEIMNPYQGLLAPGRPLWAWFSARIDGTVYPLFYGRLLGIPDDIFASIIKIRLVARPIDYVSQRETLAESLKVLPYYDPIFIDDAKLKDPDVALEGYSALWHVDRITHQTTISDIIDGEDGVVTFTAGDAFFDSIKMKVSGAPLLTCEIDTEVSWTQCDHTGKYEMKTLPNTAEDTSGAAGDHSSQGGGGVTVKKSKDQDKPPQDPTQVTYNWSYKNISPGPHGDGDLMEESGSYTDPFYGGELTKQDRHVVYADSETGQGEEYSIKESYKLTYDYYPPTPAAQGSTSTPPSSSAAPAATGSAEVSVEVEQDRAEGMYVAMRADVQPVLVDLTENEKDLIESISMSTRDLVQVGAISASGGVYFSTARGQQSIEYMLLVARAHLRAGSRIVEVEWECQMSRVVPLSCRKSAVLYDDRLPGGSALGKIVHYGIKGDGDKGEFIGSVTINCSVGNGPLTGGGAEARSITVMGTPTYVVDGYVALGYQYYDGQMLSLATNDVSYSPPAFKPVGLQIPITEDQILLRHEYHDGMTDSGVFDALQSVSQQLRSYSIPASGSPITAPPEAAVSYSRLNQQASQVIAQIYADNPTWVEMEFRPTKGLFARAAYTSEVSDLALSKQIDFGAS